MLKTDMRTFILKGIMPDLKGGLSILDNIDFWMGLSLLNGMGVNSMCFNNICINSAGLNNASNRMDLNGMGYWVA